MLSGDLMAMQDAEIGALDRFFDLLEMVQADLTEDHSMTGLAERLLMDTARGNQTLFMRLDEVLAAWSIIDPIARASAETHPTLYPAGSMGTAGTSLEQGGFTWYDPKDDSDAG